MGGIRIDRENPAAPQQQVAGTISCAIAGGQARPGEELRVANDLAAVRGMDANTVLRASQGPPAADVLEFGRRRQLWRRLLRRRLRVGVGGGLVLLAVAALVGGVLLSGRAAPGPAASMPSRVVVWTADFKIELLSSRTGRLIRTLVTGVAVTRGIPTLAVSPAGIVYFDDARGPRNYVLSVPLAGGPVTAVAQGQEPALSPDGRHLAYLTYADRGTGRPSPEEIVIRDLPAGTQRTWAFSSAGRDITNLCWSPDGRHLAFAGEATVNNGTVAVRTAQVLDTSSGGMLDGARQIPLGQRVAWAGFLTPQAGVGVLVDQHGAIQASGGLVEVGSHSGRIIGRLTSLPPHGLATGNAFDGTEHTITADRTGRYLLIVGVGTGSGEILQWTFGMPNPVQITSGARQAAWAR